MNYSQMSNETTNQQEDKEWYETLWGLVIVTVGVNLLSTWLYDKGQERKRLQDQTRERRRNRRHLRDYHNKTKEEALQSEKVSNEQSYDKNE